MDNINIIIELMETAYMYLSNNEMEPIEAVIHAKSLVNKALILCENLNDEMKSKEGKKSNEQK